MFLVIPYYKNEALISQIKLFENKDDVCKYLLIANDDNLETIHSLIENDDALTSKQKSYDFIMIENNFHIYVLYVSENGNKLYEPKRNKNGSFSLSKIKTYSTSFMPKNKVFECEIE